MHRRSTSLQVAGECQTGGNHNDGEDDEEETIDDDGQTNPVGLGRVASSLVKNADSVVDGRGGTGAHGITDGDVRHHLQRACFLAPCRTCRRRRRAVLVVVVVEVDQKNFRHQPVQQYLCTVCLEKTCETANLNQF